ncbi:MAG: sulfurtransferase [Chloroflexi bacterium]|jgi:thiosulfate/3-mercaptopyruvate sulfurtransferase|nr:sulfurtransferase [Chloroflexota bacterium]
MSHTTIISPATLFENFQHSAWVVVDCRFWLEDTEKGRRDYQAAHIPGAVYAHLDEDLSSPVQPGVTGRHPLPDVEALSRKLGTWGIGSSVQVVVYDDNGGAIASRLWWLLHWLGHEQVAVLDGGFPRWQAENLPVDAEPASPAPRTFEPRPRPDLLVTADDLLAEFGDSAYKLVDSRAPERYRGEEEPLDAVAGHIPGAVLRPFGENLAPDGSFRPKTILRGYFYALLDDTPAARTTFYCGSGVTAAHNVLAMAYAGLGMPRLYVGSWSHWITDPERPIA